MIDFHLPLWLKCNLGAKQLSSDYSDLASGANSQCFKHKTQKTGIN